MATNLELLSWAILHGSLPLNWIVEDILDIANKIAACHEMVRVPYRRSVRLYHRYGKHYTYTARELKMPNGQVLRRRMNEYSAVLGLLALNKDIN
ncbi:MAG: hypothetical protein P4L69_05995 [Desulfosporosinus sp.]|nr:hypothetical protein [Desulfosporosinus sp.]